MKLCDYTCRPSIEAVFADQVRSAPNPQTGLQPKVAAHAWELRPDGRMATVRPRRPARRFPNDPPVLSVRT